MTALPYQMDPPQRPTLGLIVLQADETIEHDFRRLLDPATQLLVSRVPSGQEVTTETLQKMEGDLAAAARLFPGSVRFDVVGYGCTSGTAQIGAPSVARQVRQGTDALEVTQPLSALIAACTVLKIRRLALLSPYIEEVSDRLRDALRDAAIETPNFATFGEAEESRVTRISAASVSEAAVAVADMGDVDGLFLSCTNLRTLDVIDALEQRLNMPVLSSNQVLAWHMATLAGARPIRSGFGRLSNSG